MDSLVEDGVGGGSVAYLSSVIDSPVRDIVLCLKSQSLFSVGAIYVW